MILVIRPNNGWAGEDQRGQQLAVEVPEEFVGAVDEMDNHNGRGCLIKYFGKSNQHWLGRGKW